MEKQEEKRAEVRINGQLYRLRFDLWALEQIEDEFGGMREAFQKIQNGGGGTVKTVRTLFRILANCQRNLDGMPENVTGDEISKHSSMAQLMEITDAIKAAMDIGMKSETNGGEADDEVHDAYLEEIEKN